ncbi:DnaJ domain-containing protein [Ruminococcaceae bacterium OttesenSCG-928-I18]|nr:DnaJ domain-containing protein [Ruminococcaceae bacterium OttesenSCG-928-I18]
MDRSTAYNVLGLPQGAGEEEVKTAYKSMAQKYDVENYEAGPLRDDAAQKMNEINEAFDVLMSFLRTGQENTSLNANTGSYSSVGRYPAIRQLINTGRVDEALAELSALQDVSDDAEWNFLMGSVYYYKGWLDQALHYFQNAVRLAPGNREYEAALRNLQNSSQGDMNGNPYMNNDPSAAAMNCACNSCALMCCMDACCGMGRGC